MFFRGHLYLNITFWRIHWSDRECLQSQSNLWHCREPYMLKPSSRPISDIRVIAETTEILFAAIHVCWQFIALSFSFSSSVPCILPIPTPYFCHSGSRPDDDDNGGAVAALAGESSLKAAVGRGRLFHLALESCAGLLNSMPSWDSGRFWHTNLLILFCIYQFKSWHKHFMNPSGDQTSQKCAVHVLSFSEDFMCGYGCKPKLSVLFSCVTEHKCLSCDNKISS